ncbi:MAG TPA: GNAT family N-acetyltransferase [Micropepsaceae bacterium]|nr:GNAT family N-acetyltransferase [Micropepsaceae bacterium]
MSPAFTVRPWTEADTEELGELFRKSVREIASRDYRPAQIEAWVKAPGEIEVWNERMRSRISFVAEEDGRLIGFIQYEPPDHIDMTYVHPQSQRKGVASALLAAVEAEARARGVPFLNVEASITSRPFFEVHGFEVITPQIVTARGQDFLNYRMSKRLP